MHLDLGSGPGPVPGLPGFLVQVVERVLELAELELEVAVELLEDRQEAQVGRKGQALRHQVPLASRHLKTSWCQLQEFSVSISTQVLIDWCFIGCISSTMIFRIFHPLQ